MSIISLVLKTLIIITTFEIKRSFCSTDNDDNILETIYFVKKYIAESSIIIEDNIKVSTQEKSKINECFKARNDIENIFNLLEKKLNIRDNSCFEKFNILVQKNIKNNQMQFSSNFSMIEYLIHKIILSCSSEDSLLCLYIILKKFQDDNKMCDDIINTILKESLNNIRIREKLFYPFIDLINFNENSLNSTEYKKYFCILNLLKYSFSDDVSMIVENTISVTCYDIINFYSDILSGVTLPKNDQNSIYIDKFEKYKYKFNKFEESIEKFIEKLVNINNIIDFNGFFNVISTFICENLPEKNIEYLIWLMVDRSDFENQGSKYFICLLKLILKKKRNISYLLSAEVLHFLYKSITKQEKISTEKFSKRLTISEIKERYLTENTFNPIKYGIKYYEEFYSNTVDQDFFLYFQENLKKFLTNFEKSDSDFFLIVNLISINLYSKEINQSDFNSILEIICDENVDNWVQINLFLALKNYQIKNKIPFSCFLNSIIDFKTLCTPLKEIILENMNSPNDFSYNIIRTCMFIKEFDSKIIDIQTEKKVILIKLLCHNIVDRFYENSDDNCSFLMCLEKKISIIYDLISKKYSENSLISKIFVDFMLNLDFLVKNNIQKLPSLIEILEILDIEIIEKISAAEILNILELKLCWLENNLKNTSRKQLIEFEKLLVYDFSTLNLLFNTIKTEESEIDPFSCENFFYTTKFFKFINREQISECNLKILLNRYNIQNGTQVLKSIQNDIISSKILYFNDSSNNIKYYILEIVNSGWYLENLKRFIDLMEKKCDASLLDECLKFTYSHILETEGQQKFIADNFIRIIETSENDQILKNLNKSFVDFFFNNSEEKKLNKLLDEYEKLNFNVKDEIMSRDELTKFIAGTKTFYQQKIDDIDKKICEFSKEDIIVTNKKNKENYKFWPLEKILAIVIRAIELVKGFKPRDVQLISVISVLNSNCNSSKILNIKTGEGKTIIIAMIAIIKALLGKKIDIITSSDQLAYPQSMEMAELYSLFDLSTSSYKRSSTNSYKTDIIYTTFFSLTSDYLDQKFDKDSAIRKRKNIFCIIDEVDSLFIDDILCNIFESGCLPPTDIMFPIYIKIATLIEILLENIVIHEKDFFLIDTFFINNNKRKHKIRKQFILRKVKESEKIRYFVIPFKISSFLSDEFLVNSSKVQLSEYLSDEAEKINIIEYVTEIITKIFQDEIVNNENKEYKFTCTIPAHLKENFLNYQLDRYIINAVRAKFFVHENRDYIIEDGEIIIMDYDSTGCKRERVSWSHGLHQFLELKHGLALTTEDPILKSHSYYSMMRRYGSEICGLTGSIGSNNVEIFMRELNQSICIRIPTFKNQQYLELHPIFTDNNDEWLKEIYQSIVLHTQNGKSVLVISEYIENVYDIEQYLLENKFESNKIVKYEKQEYLCNISKIIEKGSVILSTNIAGRGTDIKIDPEVNDCGGLHVTITFIPKNDRVYIQNCGRTSRSGLRGTSQCIINRNLYTDNVNSKSQLIKLLNCQDSEYLKSLNKKINYLFKKEILMERIHVFLQTQNDYNKLGILEQFGFWIEKNDNKLYDIDQTDQCIEYFKENFLNPMKIEENKIRNPQYVLIKLKKLDSTDYKDAIFQCNKSISLDIDNFYFESHYIKAFYMIESAKDIKNDDEYKIEIFKALVVLKNAQEIIVDKILPTINFMLMTVKNHEKLSNQMKIKNIFYSVILENIISLVGLENEKKLEAEKKKKNEELKALSMLEPHDSEDENIKIKKNEIISEINKINDELLKIRNYIKENPEENKLEIGEIRYLMGKNKRIRCKKHHIIDSINLFIKARKEKLNRFDLVNELILRENNNLQYLFNPKSDVKRDYASICLLVFIGSLEMAAGVATLFYGGFLDAPYLFEHSFDSFAEAMDLYNTGNCLNWSEYAIQKVKKSAMSLFCAGFSFIIKNVAVKFVKSLLSSSNIFVKISNILEKINKMDFVKKIFNSRAMQMVAAFNSVIIKRVSVRVVSDICNLLSRAFLSKLSNSCNNNFFIEKDINPTKISVDFSNIESNITEYELELDNDIHSKNLLFQNIEKVKEEFKKIIFNCVEGLFTDEIFVDKEIYSKSFKNSKQKLRKYLDNLNSKLRNALAKNKILEQYAIIKIIEDDKVLITDCIIHEILLCIEKILEDLNGNDKKRFFYKIRDDLINKIGDEILNFIKKEISSEMIESYYDNQKKNHINTSNENIDDFIDTEIENIIKLRERSDPPQEYEVNYDSSEIGKCLDLSEERTMKGNKNSGHTYRKHCWKRDQSPSKDPNFKIRKHKGKRPKITTCFYSKYDIEILFEIMLKLKKFYDIYNNLMNGRNMLSNPASVPFTRLEITNGELIHALTEFERITGYNLRVRVYVENLYIRDISGNEILKIFGQIYDHENNDFRSQVFQNIHIQTLYAQPTIEVEKECFAIYFRKLHDQNNQ